MPTRTLIATALSVLGAAPALAHGVSPSAGFAQAQAHAHPHGMEWLIGLAAVAAIAVLFGASQRWTRSRVSKRRD